MRKFWRSCVVFASMTAACYCLASEEMERKLIDDIVAGNATGVAEVVEYPISFSYPLCGITNKHQFIKAFPIVFDKGLRTRIASARAAEKWEDMGWRGRMYGNGMLWKTDVNANTITGINYLSGSLHGKWLDALNAELQTLPKKYRDNVTKTLSFRTEDGRWWGRLDVQNGPPSPNATGYGVDHYDCRVMLYASKPTLGCEPSDVCMCRDTGEGYESKDGQFALELVRIGTDESPGCWITVRGKAMRGDVVRWPLASEPKW